MSLPYESLIAAVSGVVRQVEQDEVARGEAFPHQGEFAAEWAQDFLHHVNRNERAPLPEKDRRGIVDFVVKGARNFTIRSTDFPSIERLAMGVGRRRRRAGQTAFLTSNSRSQSVLAKHANIAVNTAVFIAKTKLDGCLLTPDDLLIDLQRSVSKLGDIGQSPTVTTWLNGVSDWAKTFWNGMHPEARIGLVAGFRGLESFIEECFTGEDAVPRTLLQLCYWPNKDEFMRACGPQVYALYERYTAEFRSRAGHAAQAVIS
ncbi:hypothetical protein JCM10212_000831 [Sporobolomyces blumeae]